MENSNFRIAVCFMAVVTQFYGVLGHGRMYNPPSRSTAWRVGFNTPHDVNDMEAFCGGFDRQWLVNEGRCGICGDAYDEPIKPHEAPGGLYATGTIVRTYKASEMISMTIEITAVHRGYYQFKLCPNNNPARDPDQSCFEKYTLRFRDGSDRTYVNDLTSGMYTVDVHLPQGVQCTQCILQWTYVTGNRWGVCENGTGMLGCGPQETFRACADIAITGAGGAAAPAPVAAGPTTTTTTTQRPTPPRTTTAQPVAAPPTAATTTTQKPTPPRTTTTQPMAARPTTTTTTQRPTSPRTTTARPGAAQTTTTATTTQRPVPPKATTQRPAAPVVSTPTPAPKPRPAATTTAGRPGACTTYKAVGSFASVTGSNAWCQSLCSRSYCPATHCTCAS